MYVLKALCLDRLVGMCYVPTYIQGPTGRKPTLVVCTIEQKKIQTQNVKTSVAQVEHGRELCFYDGAQYHAILVEWARRGIAYTGSSDREPEEAKSQYEGRRQVRSPW